MEILIVIGIIIAVFVYQMSKCPHGIYNGNGCQACIREKENMQREEEEKQKQQKEIIRQAEEKRQEEIKNIQEAIEQQKKVWIQETKQLEFLLQLEPIKFQKLMWILGSVTSILQI
jgi:hypothetical protein